MKKQLKLLLRTHESLIARVSLTAICIALLVFSLAGCEDKSDNIPTDSSWQGIDYLMQQGWTAYSNGDFGLAYDSFLEANQRNAFYLPAYDGLGWSAVRLTDFTDAEIQFSFITTLANPATQVDLLADAYAGLCLSATIERMVLEDAGESTTEELQELAEKSIQMTQMVFDLQGEDYAPADHDPGFGSESLHLLNAQNYYYLQDFGNSEAELSIVDPDFIDTLLVTYGILVEGEVIELEAAGDDPGVSWSLTPVNPGIHHYTAIEPPDITFPLEYISYQVTPFNENSIAVTADPPEYGAIDYGWVEINPDRPGSLPGINTGLTGDNQMAGPFQIGFTFPFINYQDSVAYISSNGYITLSITSDSPENLAIPDVSNPNNFIAPYWDDLMLENGNGHGQAFYYFDEDGERFIVEWDSVAHADTSISDEYFTFEVILYPNGDIDFMYKAIELGTAGEPSATVGKENIFGEEGLQLTYNGSGPIEPTSGMGVRLYRLLEEGMEFTVSYVYIGEMAEYLYELNQRIESLIEI